jgi:hypothetical protein
MSAVCPACGVAVVPGYVRCPKCHQALAPSGRRVSTIAGGTAVESGNGLPIVPIVLGGGALLGVVLYFALAKDAPVKPEPAAEVTTPALEPTNDEPEEAQPAPTVTEPTRSPNRIDPTRVAKDLERALKNQRLWSTVELVGTRVDVRSGSCRDAGMMPTVDAARAALRAAGLTRLRCLENSGAVAFERDL